MKRRCVPLALGGMLLFFFLVAAVFPAAFTSYGQKEMFARLRHPRRISLAPMRWDMIFLLSWYTAPGKRC